MRFDPENYSPSLRQDREFDVLRLGWMQRFSPESYWLGSVLRRHDNSTEDRDDVGTPSNITAERTSHAFELQFVWRGEDTEHRFGMGRFLKAGEEAVATGPISEHGFHNNIYYYSQWRCCRTLQLSAGISWDYLREQRPVELTHYQLNPKLGLQWTLPGDTLLRVAALRTLKRSLVSNQTIEPTQVAGFNQDFEDGDATDARTVGIGLDKRFAHGASAGLEWTGRVLHVPYLSNNTASSEAADWSERSARTYFYWPLNRQVALSLEYFMERFSRSAEFTGIERITRLSTWRLPVGITWYVPQGFSAAFKVTYAQQDGLFVDAVNSEQVPGSDEFWSTDAQLGYQLPDRWGQIQFGVHNLTDQTIRYQDMDPTRLSVYPHRLAYARVALNF